MTIILENTVFYYDPIMGLVYYKFNAFPRKNNKKWK